MDTATIDERRQPGYFPYYKLQYWAADEGTLAWMDVQRRYTTPDEAVEDGKQWLPVGARGAQLRVMEVSRSSRRPLPLEIANNMPEEAIMTTETTTQDATTTEQPQQAAQEAPQQPSKPARAPRATSKPEKPAKQLAAPPAGKSRVHFPEKFKAEGALPQGTPYLKRMNRAVQTDDGKPVVDYYGHRYSLNAIRGTDPKEYEVVELMGEAQRAPRGGRGAQAVAAPAKPGKPATKKPGAQASRSRTGGKGKAGTSTSAAKTSGSRASKRTAAQTPVAA